MHKYKSRYLFFIGWILTTASYGQDNWGSDTGEIEDVEIEIIKDREITLLKANRNFEKVNLSLAPPILPKFEYKFQEFDFGVPDLTFRLRPLRIKKEQLSKLYGGYLKMGFGNFVTPYLEGYANNKRNQQYAHGIHIKHLSSKRGAVDSDNSGVSESQVDMYGKIFTEKIVLGGNLKFERNKVHFYGYPEGTNVLAENIEQQFNQVKVHGFVKSNSTEKELNYQLDVGYEHIMDDFSAKENIFSSKFDLKYPFNKENSLELDAGIQQISRTDNAISDRRFLVSVQPTYQFVYSGFKISAGLNVAYENDTLQSLGKLHLYPIANATYPINNQMGLYARFGGGIVANTYQSVIDKVPFLTADAPIYHTNRLYEFTGGIHAKVGKSGYTHLGFSLGGYKHFASIVNTAADVSRFTLAYDPQTSTVVNVFGEWTLHKSNKLQLSLRGNYYAYNMGSLPRASHHPQYKMALLVRYNIYDKIILDANLHTIGGISTFDPSTDASVDLDTVMDFGVQVMYLFSDRFSIFMKFNNVFSQEYQLLYRYPVRGFQAMGGISYTF